MEDETLATLLAKQSITDQIHRYCRAMDRVDDELGYSVWHDDAVADYGEIFQGSGREFIDFVHKSHLAMPIHAHRVSNIVIEVDGDRAGSESYVTATFAFTDPQGSPSASSSNGRYIDLWEKRDGRWAIVHRRYVHDFDDGFGTGRRLYPSKGHIDFTDPSYDVLKQTKGRQASAD